MQCTVTQLATRVAVLMIEFAMRALVTGVTVLQARCVVVKAAEGYAFSVQFHGHFGGVRETRLAVYCNRAFGEGGPLRRLHPLCIHNLVLFIPLAVLLCWSFFCACYFFRATARGNGCFGLGFQSREEIASSFSAACGILRLSTVANSVSLFTTTNVGFRDV